VADWIAKFKSHLSWQWAFLFATGAGAGVWSIFLQEATKTLFSRWFSDPPPELSYQIRSVDRLGDYQLSEYAFRQFGGSFNLQLDDDIIREYEIFNVRIRNDGRAIDHAFALDVVVNDGLAKIIDLKHVVRAPTGKSIPIKYSLPDLSWNTKKEFKSVAFSWRNPTNTDIMGSCLFRSPYREFGYGKFSLGIIKRNCIRFDVKDLLPGYYAVVAVGLNGALSELSTPTRFPESFALQPNFSDVIWIDPSHTVGDDCSPNRSRTYSSLTEAIAKAGPKRTFIVHGLRSESQSILKQAADFDNNTKIFFDDDLKFLSGRTELQFSEGLDSGSEIDFYFLTKGIPDTKRNIQLLLRGQPKLSFTIRGQEYKDLNSKRNIPVEANKRSLTPKLITTYANKNSIILMLPAGSSRKYKGIRVFRSRVDTNRSSIDLGDELNDGELTTGNLICESVNRPLNRPNLELALFDRRAPSEPPLPRRTSPNPTVRLSNAPTGLSIDIQTSGSSNTADEPMYFEDKTVRIKEKYKYVIYMYDTNGKYSYPIEIYASLDDELFGLACRVARPSN